MVVDSFLQKLGEWAKSEPLIDSVLLVGSHARNAARADSDVDVIILSTHSGHFFFDQNWLQIFGSIREVKSENYGAVCALRTFYENGLEVEFVVTTLAWASIDPIDHGTKTVIKAGAKIIIDKSMKLARLLDAVNLTI